MVEATRPVSRLLVNFAVLDSGMVPAIIFLFGPVFTTGPEAGPRYVPPLITPAATVRRFTPTDIASRPAVRLRGVVLYADNQHLFLHDESGGIYVSPPPDPQDLSAGREVEVYGLVEAGGGSCFVRASVVRDVGQGRFPDLIRATPERLSGDAAGCRWAEVEGRIEDVGYTAAFTFARVQWGRSVLGVTIRHTPGAARPKKLLGAIVRLRGAVGGIENERGEWLRPYLHVPGFEFVTVVRPGVGETSFDKPPIPIARLARPKPDNPADKRPKVSGAVTYRAGDRMTVWDEAGSVWVQAEPGQAGQVGEAVEVVGTPVSRGDTVILTEAWVWAKGVGLRCQPAELEVADLVSARHDAAFVAVEGRVIHALSDPDGWEVWVTGSPGRDVVLHARYSGPAARPPGLEPEALVRLTGVYDAGVRTAEHRYGRLLLSSLSDVVILEPPPVPWWTPVRVAGILGGIAGIGLLALAWFGTLRARVRRQTAVIGAQLYREARLDSQYRELVENAADVVFALDTEGRFTALNQASETLTGRTRADLIGRPLAELAAPGQDEVLARAARGGGPVELTLLAGGGRPVVLEVAGRRIERDGRFAGVECIARDVTERRQLEEQLRQAQKMEAVGRLAGGIAHDFNNLLTAINGFGDLALDILPPDHPARAMVAEIRKAGDRAAGLTRQLLAFGRRSVVAPQVLDLNAVVRESESLLGRLLGEHLVLTADLDPTLPRVAADPGQIQQLVMNLAVNARDAMPEGGRLTISTQVAGVARAGLARDPDVPAGEYAVLSVADTGCGMTAEVKARIFEPFFTTKGPGKGTGLGLATVYGIVRQSGGHIAVESEPGRGTEFRVYLPVARGDEASEPPPVVTPMPRRGRETVLVAEDESAVRALARRTLESSGYTVLEAADGEAAIGVAAAYRGTIDLLVTDVVMPRLGGRQLAEALTSRRPGLRVLFMSGYTDDGALLDGVRDAAVAFLPKPFAPVALVRKVREVLDGSSSRGLRPLATKSVKVDHAAAAAGTPCRSRTEGGGSA